MVNTLELANGNYVTMAVAEVTSIPYFELYDKELDRANYMNQVLFTQIISSMYRKSVSDQTAFEFLFQSVPVKNQTYKAQVRLYFIVRKIGADEAANEQEVIDIISSIKVDLEERNFSVDIFDSLERYKEFKLSLNKTNCTRTLSVGKKEKAVPNAMSANGLMYYNEVIEPSENVNTATITNALTQHPGSVISLQIIPTQYNVQELYGIEESKRFLLEEQILSLCSSVWMGHT